MLLIMSSCLAFSCGLIDPIETYSARINFIAAMFLATSAFLFIVSADLPKARNFLLRLCTSTQLCAATCRLVKPPPLPPSPHLTCPLPKVPYLTLLDR